MRASRPIHFFLLSTVLSPSLLFWKRSKGDEAREAMFATLYDTVADLYESAAYLKPHWAEAWEDRNIMPLPPKFEQDEMLPPRTIQAAREMRFARALLQRHRWRSVRQPLFEVVEPVPWATLQRKLQVVPANLLTIEEQHLEAIRQDEIDWIARAVEGFDNARSYLRTAERAGEPIERQVANSAYVAIHLSLQLSDRFIERQRFELSRDD